MGDSDLKSIARRIKERRLALGYSYQDLANVSGLSKSTLQRYETGAIGNIPLDRLECLSKALRISPEYLMGWQDSPYADEAWKSSEEEFSPQVRAIARNMQALSEKDQALLNELIKSMIRAGDEELKGK